MPSIRSITSSLSLASYRSIEPHANTASEFTLPCDPRLVVKHIHRDFPKSLPAPDEDVHEVRFYLYSLLTVESTNIAKRWPQWVLETCAYWKGDSAALRSRSKKDLENICPLNSGHAQLLVRGHSEDSPPPECRTAIGGLVSRHVDKMLRQEVQQAKVHEEWKRTQIGDRYRPTVDEELSDMDRALTRIDSSRRYAPSIRSRNSFSNHLQTQRLDEMHAPAPSPSYFPTMGDPTPHWPEPYQRLHENSRTSSLSTSRRGIPSESIHQSSSIDSPVSSKHESYFSDRTCSTDKTSPPASLERYQVQTGQQNGSYRLTPRRGSRSLRDDTLLNDRRSSYRLSSSSIYSLGVASSASHGHSTQGLDTDVQTSSRRASIASNSTVASTDWSDRNAPNALHRYANDSRANRESPNLIMLQNPIQQQTMWNTPQNRSLYPGQMMNPSMPVLGLQERRNEITRQTSNYSMLSVASAPDDHMLSRAPTPIRRSSTPIVGTPGSVSSSTRNFSKDLGPATSGGPRSNSLSRSHGLAPVAEHAPMSRRPSSSILSVESRTLRKHNLETIDEAPTFALRRPPSVSQSSMAYPSASVASSAMRGGSRSTTPTPSIISSRPRSVAPSIMNQFPIRRKKSVPVVDNLAGAQQQRTKALDDCDRSAFERGAYKYFTRSTSPTSTVLRLRVLAREEERMHGMVPSNLVGEGLEHIGPAVRVLDPRTGKPHRTMVEIIREREVLEGKRQRGARGIEGLDSESPTTDLRFCRGF
ncbi:hypothetical protein BDV96DRAFT_158432 [Lophiotrema nucula]|uniref:Uncharacterized protein n=1 Tax=Lophiotrema nucula TaxID=690887 RepID=A0A6A5Z0D6_9PLEO|nr:hypothetical protein BDV96DRAFT_158432 [Lophiotrema nucula]